MLRINHNVCSCPIPVKAPWHMIGIDFVGPISPTADDGSRYVLTISGYFTKWVEAIPTADKCASTVVSALYQVTSMFVFKYSYTWV